MSLIAFLSLFHCGVAPIDHAPADSAAAPRDTGLQDTGLQDTDLPDLGDTGPQEPATYVPVCLAGTPWTSGEQAFRDATEHVGLTALGIHGTKFTAVDFDGDGWVDLAVHGGRGMDYFTKERQHAWLLRNNRAGGFVDVTARSGLIALRPSTSPGTSPAGPNNPTRDTDTMAWADIDGDGDLDLFTGSARGYDDGRGHSEILLNDGHGVFTLAPEADNPWLTNDDPIWGASFADVNRDGHVDLWLTVHNTLFPFDPHKLFLGDGTGKFRPGTKAANLDLPEVVSVAERNAGAGRVRSTASNACDLNGDGAPELLVSAPELRPNQLWLNDGAGAFTNISVASGYAYDENQDWTNREDARCYCEVYRDGEECDGVPAPSSGYNCVPQFAALAWDHTANREPYLLGGHSGATTCADLDNDGDIDLLTTEARYWFDGDSIDHSEILLNDGSGTFTRPGNAVTGLIYTQPEPENGHYEDSAEVFDFDNDGWPDIFIGDLEHPGAYGRLYRQAGPLQFVEIPLTNGAQHLNASGQVAADFDHDGDLDLIVGVSPIGYNANGLDLVPRYYENLDADPNFVQLQLTATSGSNTAAIGARVRITARHSTTLDTGTQPLPSSATQTQVVQGGGGQWGDQTDLVLHFGLGALCAADAEVTWPSGLVQTFPLNSGYRYLLTEGGAPSLAPWVPR